MLTADERKLVADLLRVAANHLRDIADRGPRMTPPLCDTFLRYAETADTLRVKVEEMQS